MKRFSALFLISLFATGSVFAVGAGAKNSPAKEKAPAKAAPSPAAADASPAPVGSPAPLDIKTKSTFQMDNGTRNPFWPIGWKPAARQAGPNENEHAGPEIPATAFLLTSVAMDRGNKFAIINGKIMQEGQQFGLAMGNQTYQLTVKAILDGKVVLSRHDQEIVITLRRK